jgi:uncharacterized protein (UPF0147 family)
MAGLLDIFGTGGADTLGLLGMSQADIGRNRDDAQAQALYALAGRLFQGGNTGQSIAQGLQAGQQAYKGGMQDVMQSQLQNFQLQELLRKRKEDEMKRQLEQQALAERQQVQQQVQRAYQPEVFADTPLTNMMGQQIAGPNQPQAAGMGLTPQIVNQLMASEQGQAKLAQLSDLMPKIRKAGLGVEQKAEDNPFLVFTQDQTIPKNIKTLADQYAKSWASGRLDPDVADKRVSELASMAQRAQDKDTAQANLKAQQDQMAEFRRQGLAQSAEARALQGEIAKGNLAIREADAAAKAEERNKPVAEAKETLKLLDQAEKLLDTATGSLTGTAVDVVAGALGSSTKGAQSASKLKAIQGALVAKMPKMSGPQSDKDVLLYREMAGQIGDSTLPNDTRKAALQTIREIQERYAKVPEGSSKPAMAPTSPFKYSPAKEDRYQQWLKQQGG